MPWRANFLAAVPSQSRKQKNAAVFANRISWRKSQSLQSQKSPWVRTTNVSHKEKNRYSECYKNALYAGPKYFDKLKPEPGLTYNSALNSRAYTSKLSNSHYHNHSHYQCSAFKKTKVLLFCLYRYAANCRAKMRCGPSKKVRGIRWNELLCGCSTLHIDLWFASFLTLGFNGQI